METTLSSKKNPFLQGGGEMGTLITAFDWSQTSLGALEQWPVSLRVQVSLMLASRFPMLIFWGPDLITFYNDAFRPSLGNNGKHPSSLGQRGEESWAESWPTIGPMIYNIMAGGGAVWFEDQKLPIYRDGKMGYAYWTYSFSPVSDDAGAVAGVLVTCSETTKAVESVQRLEKSESRFQNLVRDATAGIIVLAGEEMKVEIVNEACAKLIDRTVDELFGKNLFEIIPETEAYFRPVIEGVRATGEPVHLYSVPYAVTTAGTKKEGFLNLVYQPFREADGAITGVIVLCQDVTEQVLVQQRIEESQRQLLASFEDSPVGLAIITGEELVFKMVNPFYAMLTGRPPEALIGKTLLTAIPELEGQGFDDRLRKVMVTGEAFIAKEAPVEIDRGNGRETIYIDHTYQPQRDANGRVTGVLVVVIDITQQVLTRQATEESELFARSIIDNSPVAKVVFVGENMKINIVNQNMLQMLGRDESIIGKPFMEAMPELIPTPLMDRLRHVYHTGETYIQPEEQIELIKQGQSYTGYYNYIYKALRNTAGGIYGIVTTATEVTEQVLSRQKVEEAEAKLLAAIELAELGTWDIDLTTRRTTYSPRLQKWLGIREGVLDLQASPRIHEKDRERVSQAILKAIEPGGAGTFDETYTILHLQSGQERIIHANGRTIFDTQGKPVSISGTAQDVTIQQELQLALENEVHTRTEELAAAVEELRAANENLYVTNDQLIRSNEELAQYAYVASHDLQEPLRKIRLFASKMDLLKNMPAEGKFFAEKISRSTERMTALINDLLEFSRLLNTDQLLMSIDLNSVVAAVISDFELVIEEKNVTVSIGLLPVIEGVQLQMNQLFYNLISNALKFTDPVRKPRLQISAAMIETSDVQVYIPRPLANVPYCRITVADNGIGFDAKQASQIFEVFKRLHSRDVYPGSGIGLALCRRIVANHKGHLYAEAETGRGSSFYIIIPSRQSVDFK